MSTPIYPSLKAVVYKATNLVNGKVYVGVTSCSLQYRKDRHKSAARLGNPNILYSAIRKYGWENFEWEILAETEDIEFAFSNLEPKYIRECHSHCSENGYNMTYGGRGTPGHIYSEETRKKISALQKERLRNLTPEERKIRAAKSTAASRSRSLCPDFQTLHRLYVTQNKPSTEIGRIYGVAAATVCRWLEKFEIECDPVQHSFKREAPPREELEELYCNQRMTVESLRIFYGTGPNTILEWLKECGIKTRAAKEQIEIPAKDKIEAAYVQGGPAVKEIAKQFGVCAPTLGKWLRFHGIDQRLSYR